MWHGIQRAAAPTYLCGLYFKRVAVADHWLASQCKAARLSISFPLFSLKTKRARFPQNVCRTRATCHTEQSAGAEYTCRGRTQHNVVGKQRIPRSIYVSRRAYRKRLVRKSRTMRDEECAQDDVGKEKERACPSRLLK